MRSAKPNCGAIECVVHQNVNPAVSGDDLVDCSGDLVNLAHLAHNADRRATGLNGVRSNAINTVRDPR